MKRIFASLLLAFTVTVAPVVTTPAYAKDLQTRKAGESFADLAEKLLPAVVNISSTQKYTGPEDLPDMPHFPPGSPFEDFFEEFLDRNQDAYPALPPSSLGSGFVVDAENGYIVTNNHVIADAEEVKVTFHDDTTLDAEIIGRDDKTDLALLKVTTKKKLTAIKFGNSDSMRVGDWIIAIGNPFGLGGTVTAGIISAQQRDINAGPYDDFIQTDASINRGNSGGPMFDMNGEVIGINTAIYSPSGGSVGIGFAIPSNLAEPVIKQLIKFGHTRRGWLGVRIQSVSEEIADSLGLKKATGALIASVTKDGPAEKAGLKAGDIILSFNGRDIEEMRGLPRIVAETPIGEDVEVVYWRDGKTGTTKVSVGELEKAEENGQLTNDSSTPAPSEQGVKVKSVGLVLGTISGADRSQYNIPDDIDGVLITKVEDLSEAAEKGLLKGDVIVEINQKPVKNPKEVASIIADADKAGRKSVLLLVQRQGDVRFVALRLKDS